GQLVAYAVQGEGAAGDPIAVAADQAAEVGVLGQVGLQPVEAEHHIADLAAAIGHAESPNQAAVADHLDLHPAAPAQRVELHLRSVAGHPEDLAVDAHPRLLL